MRHPRRSPHGRRTIAVSVLTAGAVALSGSAAMVASASAAPATTRDALPADPAGALTPILALVAQLTDLVGPVLTALESFDLGAVVAGLTDGQLGQLLTQLTRIQLAEVLNGDALNRALASVTTLSTPQLLALLETTADALHDDVPQPAGFVLQTLLEVVSGVLGQRHVELPTQVTSLLAQPAVTPAPAAAAAAASVLRARIFGATAARDRRSVRVELTCPAVSDTACAVTVRTSVAGRSAAAVRRVTIPRGRTKVVRPALTAAARKRLLARGGTVRITVATKGSSRGAVTSAVRVPAPRG